MGSGKRILIRRSSGWEDVTGKDVIIYGAGQGCIDLMREWQVPNVKYVIDSDGQKWGSTLLLLDQVYSVQPPELLVTLPLEKYYIIISSCRYAEEIKNKIADYAACEELSICEDIRTLLFCYPSLEEMLFYDPRIKKSLVAKCWSYNLDELIRVFSDVSDKVFPGEKIEQFISLGNGCSRIAFCFCVKEDFYIFSMPALYCYCDEEAKIHDPGERVLRYQFRKKYGIGNELTLYENSRGVLIQHFADLDPDCSSEAYERSVLKKCYELHHSPPFLTVKHDVLKQVYQSMSKQLRQLLPSEKSRIEKLDSKVRDIFDKMNEFNQDAKICHGDLHVENTVLWKDKLFFIDWECMTLGNPLYDVCKFLYSCKDVRGRKKNLPYHMISKEIYHTLRDDLSFYYGRSCTDSEYQCAYLVMQATECTEFLCTSYRIRFLDREIYEDLRKRLENELGGE